MNLYHAIIAALALAVGLLWWANGTLRDDLKAEEAEVARLTASNETAEASNTAWEATAERRNALLRECQDERTRVREEGEAAVEAARREAASIGRAFDRFVSQFRERPAHCEAALQAADVACASLELY